MAKALLKGNEDATYHDYLRSQTEERKSESGQYFCMQEYEHYDFLDKLLLEKSPLMKQPD